MGLPRLNFYTVWQAWGNDVSSWSTDNIQDAGSIIGGLSVTEIGNLDLSSNDVIEAISGYDVYSTPQVNVHVHWLHRPPLLRVLFACLCVILPITCSTNAHCNFCCKLTYLL